MSIVRHSLRSCNIRDLALRLNLPIFSYQGIEESTETLPAYLYEPRHRNYKVLQANLTVNTLFSSLSLFRLFCRWQQMICSYFLWASTRFVKKSPLKETKNFSSFSAESQLDSGSVPLFSLRRVPNRPTYFLAAICHLPVLWLKGSWQAIFTKIVTKIILYLKNCLQQGKRSSG